MPDWLLILFGVVVGVMLLTGVFLLSVMPRSRKRRPWLAPKTDDPHQGESITGASYGNAGGWSDQGGSADASGHGGD